MQVVLVSSDIQHVVAVTHDVEAGVLTVQASLRLGSPLGRLLVVAAEKTLAWPVCSQVTIHDLVKDAVT